MGFLSGLFKSYTYHSEGKNASFPQTPRQWALATNAVLSAFNGMQINLVGGCLKESGTISGMKLNLQRSWGISSRESLLETLNWLKKHGHRGIETIDSDTLEKIEGFMSIYNNQKANVANYLQTSCLKYNDLMDAEKKNIEKNDFLAWDLVRYINLVGMGYIADYIKEEEVDSLIVPVAKILQEKFDNWEELGMNYIVGRGYWNFDESDHEMMVEELEKLLQKPNSPWVQLGFKSVQM